MICEKQLSPWTIFAKHFIVDVWQDSEYASDFEYARVLNIWGLWIFQVCEYARVLNMLLILNIIGSENTTVLNMPGLYRVLNMPEYAWIIPGYAWLCLNVPISEWFLFYIYPL